MLQFLLGTLTLAYNFAMAPGIKRDIERYYKEDPRVCTHISRTGAVIVSANGRQISVRPNFSQFFGNARTHTIIECIKGSYKWTHPVGAPSLVTTAYMRHTMTAFVDAGLFNGA